MDADGRVTYIYAAALIITIEGTTKILRREIATCPLDAVRKIIGGLVRDTGVLFGMFFYHNLYLPCSFSLFLPLYLKESRTQYSKVKPQH
jgi:hypothetical protein